MKTRVKVLIVSGSDLKPERDMVIDALLAAKKQLPHLHIEPVELENDLSIGSFQDIANREDNVGACDILVMLLFSRIGQLEKDLYRLALAGGKKILIYFKTGFSPSYLSDIKEFVRVLEFKEEIEKENRFSYKTYDSVEDFKEIIAGDLTRNLFIAKIVRTGVEQNKRTFGAAVPLTPLSPRLVDLIGQEKYLPDMEAQLKSQNRVLLVHGIGGSGKTELCNAFLRNQVAHFQYIGWLDYTTDLRTTFISQFKIPDLNIQSKSTPEERFQMIHDYLTGLGNDDMLLFVDNIDRLDDPDLALLNAYRFKIIANSRFRIKNFSIYEIEPLNENECTKLFYNHYIENSPVDEAETHEIEIIARKVGYHPLTIALLAQFAKNAAMSALKLNRLMDRVDLNLEREIKEKIKFEYGKSTIDGYLLEHLKHVFDLSGLSGKEKFILSNISVLSPQPIYAVDIKNLLNLEELDVVYGIVDKGWLNPRGNKLEMPFVIGKVVRETEPPGVEKCRDLIASLSAKLYMEPGDNPNDKKEYLGFGESVVKYIDGDDLKLATLMNNISMVYQALGQFDRALQLQERATKIYENIQVEKTPTLAASYNNLAAILKATGQLGRALEFQEKALAVLESVLDKNNPSIAISYSNISGIYQDMGELEKALTFEEKALEIREATMDKNHPDLALSYHNLSTIYQNMGELEKALTFEEKALKMRVAALEQNHPDLAQSYNHLGRIFFSLGRFEESLDYQQKAVGIIKLYPGIHPLAESTYIDLSLVLQSMGRLDEALDYGKKGMEILRNLYPEGHPRLEQLTQFVTLIRNIMAHNPES